MTYKVARSKIGLSLRSPTNFNKNIQRIETLTDTKIFIEIGYDKNSNRRYAKARMIGEDPTSDPFKRESWYDYTVGNRVILRDCILKDGKNITIAPGQGMKLDYRRDRITTQTTRNEAGNLEVKALGYDAAQLLRHINTRELFDDGRKGDRVLSDVERRIDHAQRCDQVHQFRHDHKEQKTTETVDETTQFDQNNNTRKQTRVEITGKFNGKPKDRERTDNLRTIDKASNTGRVLRETSKLTGTIKTKDKDGDDREIPFTITDAAKHGHVATGNGGIREGDVSVNRTIDCDDKNFQYDKRVPVEATQTTTQDANGHTASVRGPKHPGSENDSYRSFVTTPVDDCIVYKQTQAGRNYYIYAELKPGKMVLQAYFGDLVDRDDGALSAWKPKVVNLDTNHQALSAQYPPPMATEYTVPRRMTFRELAEELNYTGYASRIAEDNNKYEGDYIEAGERIIIRPLYFEIPETAWNGRMPSVDSIIGSLYPSLPSPHIWLKPEKHKVNWLATFLEVAAFSAIMAFLPGALVAGPNLLGAILSYGAAGLVGGTVDQMIAMGFGEQKGFDLRALATTTLTAAISGGVLQQNGLLKVAAKGAEAATKAATVAQTMAKVSIDRAIIVATEMAVAQHAFLLATGLERKFDWRTLGVSAFNAVVGHGINHTVGNQALNIGLNTALTSVAGSLIMHQKIDAAHLTASIAGQIVGNLAASPLVERNKRAAEEEARKEKAAPKATPKQKAAEVQKQAGKKQKPVNDKDMRANYKLPNAKLDTGRAGYQTGSTSLSEFDRYRMEHSFDGTWMEKYAGNASDIFAASQAYDAHARSISGNFTDVFTELGSGLYAAATNPVATLRAMGSRMEENLDSYSNPKLWLANEEAKNQVLKQKISQMYDEVSHGRHGIFGSGAAEAVVNLAPVGKVLGGVGKVLSAGKLSLFAGSTRGIGVKNGIGLTTRLNRTQIKEYLANVQNISREQLIKDLESLGLNYKGGSKDGKFMNFINRQGKTKVQIHPSDRVTTYDHIHIHDYKNRSLGSNLQRVHYKSPDAHIEIPSDKMDYAQKYHRSKKNGY